MSYSNTVANLTRSHKLLNDVFDSFAEAYDAFAALVGNDSDEISPKKMVRHFLTALQLPIFEIDTDRLLHYSHHYFESTKWLSDFLEKYHFFQYDDDQYISLDYGNRPVAMVRIIKEPRALIEINGVASKDIYEALLAEVENNVKLDTSEIGSEDQSKYYHEAVIQRSPFGDSIGLERKKMQHTGKTHPAFYPYLNGGVEALISDFIASDETVLILMGEPGTGKSTAISSAIINLNLFPIYAKKTEVITRDDFISKMFSISDDFMEKSMIANNEKQDRSLLFKDSSFFSQMAVTPRIPQPVVIDNGKKPPMFPILVVEDGDEMLKPRSKGNKQMPELLNETDGVGSAITRKIIITTNLTDKTKIEPALWRDGRQYLGEPLHFRLLTPMEAIEARAAAGLPAFEVTPQENISLATALRKPRKKIYLKEGEIIVQERSKLN